MCLKNRFWLGRFCWRQSEQNILTRGGQSLMHKLMCTFATPMKKKIPDRNLDTSCPAGIPCNDIFASRYLSTSVDKHWPGELEPRWSRENEWYISGCANNCTLSLLYASACDKQFSRQHFQVSYLYFSSSLYGPTRGSHLEAFIYSRTLIIPISRLSELFL